MKIAIACDHGGYLLKQDILIWLEENDIDYEDFGCYSTESVDYPVFAERAARAVAAGECDKGIVICTTGIGVSIAANKVKGIRCALCTDSLQAEMTRRHNDANMMAIGAGFTGPKLASAAIWPSGWWRFSCTRSLKVDVTPGVWRCWTRYSKQENVFVR